MATQMIDGFGEIHLRSNPVGLYIGGYAQVTLEGESETSSAFRFNNSGKRIRSDSRIDSEAYTLTIVSETIDLNTLEVAVGEQASTNTSATYYEVVSTVVPAASPFEITLPNLSATNEASLIATLEGNGAWNLISGTYSPLRLTTITGAGTPTQFQVKADGTNTKAIFASSLAGAPVSLAYQRTVATKPTIGKSISPTLLKTFAFSCKIISDEFPNGLIFEAPQISKSSLFSFGSDGVSTIENTFELGTKAGERSPFYLIEL